jgi:hypothetical protein
VLQLWGRRVTRRRSPETLVASQRRAAPPTKPHCPRRALKSWVPFSEQVVESVVEDGTAHPAKAGQWDA